MKAADIKKMSEADIRAQITETRDALAKMKFSHTLAGTENPMTLRERRRDIARMLTVLEQMKNNSK